MTHEPQLPKPTSANGSTGKGKRWNPLRIDKPLLPRTATTPQSALAQPYLSETAEEDDPTAIDSPADSPQGKAKRLPQLPKVVQTVPKVLKKRVGGIRLPNWKVLALIGFLVLAVLRRRLCYAPQRYPTVRPSFGPWPRLP